MHQGSAKRVAVSASLLAALSMSIGELLNQLYMPACLPFAACFRSMSLMMFTTPVCCNGLRCGL